MQHSAHVRKLEKEVEHSLEKRIEPNEDSLDSRHHPDRETRRTILASLRPSRVGFIGQRKGTMGCTTLNLERALAKYSQMPNCNHSD